MPYLLRILLIIGAFLLMFFMLKKIRQAKLKIEYIIFWLFFSFILVIMGLFPKMFYWLSNLIVFQSPINMIYLAIILGLIIKVFFTTIQISKLENKIDSLTQQIAIDRKKDLDEKSK